ncbi:MAG TPA: hypothetical protein ENK66_05870 [Arcobacter sp.]|nr:hypothetical protein [Arcobacter sp.]
MYKEYFDDYCEVKSDFKKEFVSLWSGWLGEENYHKLENVTENEWGYFNKCIRLIAKQYSMYSVNCNDKCIKEISNIEDTLSTYENSLNKNETEFIKYVIPELKCIITEEWDYTYIIWYKNNKTLKSLETLIKQSGLFHFSE